MSASRLPGSESRPLGGGTTDGARGCSQPPRLGASAPERNAALGHRVGAVEPRIVTLAVRVDEAKAAQGRRLADIAVRELEDQRKRLDEYSVQARYALATIYDRAAAAPPAAPREPAP